MPTPVDATSGLRGAAVGTLSALVTAAAHQAGGGMSASTSALVLLVAACAAVGAVASTSVFSDSRARPALHLMAVLAVAQLLGHVMLTVVDGHHHGPVLTDRMTASHVAAIVLGAFVIRAAEHGVRRAASLMRRVLPVLVAVIVERDDASTSLPAYRAPVARGIVDLSGCGTRGPPVSC